MGKVCIGIDLGGTFIKFGLLDENREASTIFQLPTPQDEGIDAVIDQMVTGARQAMDKARARQGRRRRRGHRLARARSAWSRGSSTTPRTSRAWSTSRCATAWPRRSGLPCSLENDANAAGLGEFLCGAGKLCRDMVLLTLGTGVGGGVIVDGKVLHGAHEIGAELGHTLIVPDGRLCGCGQHGCIEQYCSATFMSQHAAKALASGNGESSLRQVLADNGKLTSKDICEHRNAGDAFAAKVWDEMCRYLAMGCVTYSRILDPDRIVLAGGMAAAGDDLLGPVNEHYREMHWKMTEPRTEIALATLGNDAGVIGAAGVAWQEHGSWQQEGSK